MNSNVSYTDLQTSIDQVIGKIGLNKTKTLIDSFLQNTSISVNDGEKIKMITSYLISTAIKIFDLREDLFYISTVEEYRDARMCCFHLLRNYTQDTYPKIGLNFKCSSRRVMYGYFTVESRLEVKEGNGKFVANYLLLEEKFIEFLGKIN